MGSMGKAVWQHLSLNAAQALADLLNAIESGLEWPEPQYWGKAHIVAKDDEASLSPKDYRILLVLQRLYRRWASIRLQHLSGWVTKWQLPEMYAGVKGGGADLAWLSTAIDTEQATLELRDFLKAMLDVWKCFDQIVPLLARTVLALVGMPTTVLWAHTRLMAGIKVANCLPLGVGKEYSRICSIPQGCPWSMTVLALLTYPWIKMIRRHTEVVPRVLADDLSLWAAEAAEVSHDPNKWQHQWAAAVQLTLMFLDNMGARTAHNKSMILASNSKLRKWAAKAVWGSQQQPIPVTTHTRNLGAFSTQPKEGLQEPQKKECKTVHMMQRE